MKTSRLFLAFLLLIPAYGRSETNCASPSCQLSAQAAALHTPTADTGIVLRESGLRMKLPSAPTSITRSDSLIFNWNEALLAVGTTAQEDLPGWFPSEQPRLAEFTRTVFERSAASGKPSGMDAQDWERVLMMKQAVLANARDLKHYVINGIDAYYFLRTLPDGVSVEQVAFLVSSRLPLQHVEITGRGIEPDAFLRILASLNHTR